MIPKTAIIGADGLLGTDFLKAHRKFYADCVGTTRSKNDAGFDYFDLSSPDISHLRLSESGHKDVLIFAGVSKISTCESDVESVKKINLDGTIELIKQCVAEGLKPIFFSSDQVFDGISGRYENAAPVNPLNNYGKFKAQVEESMKELCGGRYLVIRLCKIFTLEKGSNTILDEMAATLMSGKIVRAAYDQIFNLTFLADIIEVVSALQEQDACGVYNVCSPEIWSRYDLALKVADCLQVNKEKIEQISLDELGESFPRPKNTSMVINRLSQEVNYSFTPIMQCVEKITENWKVKNLAEQ